MKKIQGIRNNKGYTEVRIWLGPKRNLDGSFNPPYCRSFGLYNNANILLAKTHIEEARSAFERGNAPPPKHEALGVPVACDIYHKFHYVNKRGRSAESIRNVAYKLNYFRHFWPKEAWHNMTPQAIESYVVWRKGQKGPKGEPIEDSTINGELNILSSMFTVIEELVTRRDIAPYFLPTTLKGQSYNPVAFVPRDSFVTNERKRVATEEELIKVKVWCDEHDKDLLEMIKRAILSGLRRTDLSKVNGKKDVEGVLSKSKQKKLFSMPLDFSEKIKTKNYRRRWNALREACGMMDFHWHDWRHSAATMLDKLGFTTKDIQKFLGHATEEMTERYINRGKERLRPQTEGLDVELERVWKGAPVILPQPPKDLNAKVCTGCKKVLPMDSFGKHSAFKDGKNSCCKRCNNLKTVERRKENPGLRANEYAKYVDPRRSPSSAVERSLHMGEAVGSNPSETTISETSRGGGKGGGKSGTGANGSSEKAA